MATREHTVRDNLTSLTAGLFLIACVVVPQSADAAQIDPSTDIPLHTGLTLQQQVDSFVCGKPTKITLYDTDMGPLAGYVTWYKAQLPGYQYVHTEWSNRPQEMFFAPDGTKGVSITGTPQGGLVFAISYMKLSAAVPVQRLKSFSPNNPSCK